MRCATLWSSPTGTGEKRISMFDDGTIEFADWAPIQGTKFLLSDKELPAFIAALLVAVTVPDGQIECAK